MSLIFAQLTISLKLCIKFSPPAVVFVTLRSFFDIISFLGRPTFMGSGSGGGISGMNRNSAPFYKSLKQSKKHHRQPLTPADAAKVNCGGGVGRKTCSIS